VRERERVCVSKRERERERERERVRERERERERVRERARARERERFRMCSHIQSVVYRFSAKLVSTSACSHRHSSGMPIIVGVLYLYNRSLLPIIRSLFSVKRDLIIQHSCTPHALHRALQKRGEGREECESVEGYLGSYSPKSFIQRVAIVNILRH
jgi:hypothetical protein